MTDEFKILIIVTTILVISLFIVLKITGSLSKITKRIKFFKFDDQADISDIYIQLVHNAINPMIAIDINGNVLAWNKRAEIKFGWSQEEVLEKELSNFIIPPELAEKHKEGLRVYKETGQSKIVGDKFGAEFEAVKKNGERIPIRLYLFELNKEKDGHANIGGVIVDITKEKEKENEYSSKIAFLEQGEKDASIGTWKWDLIGKDVEISKNFYSLFNLDKNDKLTADRLLELVYFKDRAKTVKAINSAVKDKKPYVLTYRRMQEDGLLSWIQVIGNFIYDNDGEVKVIHGTIQKIKKEETTKKPIQNKKTLKSK